MGWLDTTNALGGMCIADQNLVTQGIVGDGSFYRVLRPAATRRIRPRATSLRGSDSPGSRLQMAGRSCAAATASSTTRPKGREIDGSADIYPYVSRGNYPQSIGQLTPLQTTDSLFPVFSNPGRSRRRPTASSR